MAQCDAEQLIADACVSGFTCRTEPELLVLLNQLLCNFSSSGTFGLLFSSGDLIEPVLPPSNPAIDQVYFAIANNPGIWFWNASSATWIKVAAN